MRIERDWAYAASELGEAASTEIDVTDPPS
jgi:hypothetical protein